jgi:DNA-binding XRE family transcriptional regulator
MTQHRETKAARPARRAAAPLYALFDKATFAKVLAKSTKNDRHFHDGGDGGDAKKAAWWRAKILTSSFLVHCRKGASEAGWTQDQLAQALGVSRSYIAQVESLNSSTKAPLDLLIQAATVTGTPFQIGVPDDLPSTAERIQKNERVSVRKAPKEPLPDRQR